MAWAFPLGKIKIAEIFSSVILLAPYFWFMLLDLIKSATFDTLITKGKRGRLYPYEYYIYFVLVDTYIKQL